MIMQIDPEMMPIMVVSADFAGMTQSEISSYVVNELVPGLESVEGIASVSATGVLEERIQVTLDDSRREKTSLRTSLRTRRISLPTESFRCMWGSRKSGQILRC